MWDLELGWVAAMIVTSTQALDPIKTRHFVEKLPTLLSLGVTQPGCSKWPEKQPYGYLGSKPGFGGSGPFRRKLGLPTPCFLRWQALPKPRRDAPLRSGQEGWAGLCSSAKAAESGGLVMGLLAGVRRAQPCLPPGPGSCWLWPGS